MATLTPKTDAEDRGLVFRRCILKVQFLFCLVMPILVSCTTLPANVAELRTSRVKSEVFCHDEPFALIVDRVDAFLSRCYSPKKFSGATYAAGIFVARTIDVNWHVVESPLEKGKRFVVQTDYGYALAADIRQGGATCPTFTQYFAAQGLWAKRFPLLDQATKGVTPECGY